MFQLKLTLDSENDTSRLAKILAENLNKGTSIGLIGELGSGKTAFVKHLAKALGIMETVSSPSFVLQHEYSSSKTDIVLEHWDLYRLNQPPLELYEPVNSNCIRAIEWANKLPSFETELDFLIEFEIPATIGENSEAEMEKRVVSFSSKQKTEIQDKLTDVFSRC